MNKELRKILRQCSFEHLKVCLGNELVDLAEYVASDLTAPVLVDVALGAYGKELLAKQEIRYMLLINSLSLEDIMSLGTVFGISGEKSEAVALDISKIPFGYNDKSRLLLQKIGLSEEYLPEEKSPPESSVEYISSNNDFIFEQLDYQFDLRRRVIRNIREVPGARGLIHMPTGAGKTKTAMHIIQELWSFDYEKAGVVLWIAHSEELLRQAIATFLEVWNHLGQFDVSVQKLWGGFKIEDRLQSRTIIFGGIQKMQAVLKKDGKELEEIRESLNLIIVDECHRAPAQKTHELILNLVKDKNIFGRFPNLLGLTATPGRSRGFDIEDKKLRHLFDGVKLGIDVDLMNRYDPGLSKAKNEIELLQGRNILSTFNREPIVINPNVLNLSPSEVNQIRKAVGRGEDKDISKELLQKIASNKKRNKLILDKLVEINDQGLKVIFFACNVNHAKMINAALFYQGIQTGLVLGETSSQERHEVISKFKQSGSDLNVLVNVSVLTTGFDSPNIDCVFISRPVGSVVLYSQMIGRGIRGPMMGGKEKCLLVDVVDNLEMGDEKWAFNYFDSYWK